MLKNKTNRDCKNQQNTLAAISQPFVNGQDNFFVKRSSAKPLLNR